MKTVSESNSPCRRAKWLMNVAVRRFARTAAVTLLLVFGAGASATGQEPKDTTIPVPDPGILYVRYGPPGGVKIHSVKRPAAAETPADSPDARHWQHRVNRILLEELGLLTAGDRATRWVPAVSTALDRTGAQGTEAAPPGSGLQPLASASGRPSTNLIGVLPAAAGPDLADLTTQEAAAELEVSGVLRTTHIRFAYDKSDILPGSAAALQTVGEVLRNNPGWAIRVEGHADARGTEVYNFELSRRRAEAVRAYLITQCGAEEERLTSIGLGESVPLVADTTEEAHAANRRVEFRMAD